MTRLPAFLCALRRSTAAVAMTEFALGAPLMLTAGLYGLEMSNYAVTSMKVNQLATQIADNASRIGDTSTLTDRKIYEADIDDLLSGADEQAGNSVDLFQYGRVIISSLETDPNDPTGTQQYIHWQRCKGRKHVDSAYGGEGTGKGDPSFVGMGPPGEEVTAMPGEAVMFVEVSYDYQPLVTDAFLPQRTIQAVASFTVRDSRDLTQIYETNPGAPSDVADCGTFDSFSPTAKLAPFSGGGWNWDWVFSGK